MRSALPALLSLCALAASVSSLASPVLPESKLYVRIRLNAALPAHFVNELENELLACNGARCLSVFRFDSTLEEGDASNTFRQVEYFSGNRLQAAADQLGSPTLEALTLRLRSSLPGPRELTATENHAFAAGTASPLRKQLATSLADAAIQVPNFGTIALHSEVTLLEADVRDVTGDFQRAPAPTDAELFQRLRKYRVVLVTGADGYKARYFGTEYFDGTMKWLTAGGIENQRVIPGTNRPLEEQAAEFARTINALGANAKPVLLVNFSIANSNFLHYLLSHPEASRVVAGWLAVNSSFLGNPLNEDYYNNPFERDLTHLFSPAKGLEDMRYVARDAYVDANYERILKAVRSIPSVITVDSRINDTDFKSTRQKRFLELNQRGIDNDGSTGTFSHYIPGSEAISLDGTDHELLSKGTNAYGVDPIPVYRKLFLRMIDEIEGSAK